MPEPPNLPRISEGRDIPVTEFFAERDALSEYKVSPDGLCLAWIASARDRLTVHVRHRDSDEVVAIDTHSSRSLLTFRWAADSRHVLFEQDRSGDQNQHVYVADTARPGEQPVDLTPIGAARAAIHRILAFDPEHILVAHNARTRRGFDLIRIGIRSGESQVVATNPGDVIQWITDLQGRLRGRIRAVDDGARLVEWHLGSGWRPGLRLDLEESFNVVGFTPDGLDAWVVTNLGRDLAALVRLDLDTNRLTLVHEHSSADVETAVASDVTGELLWAAAYPGYQEVSFFDMGLRDAFCAIRDAPTDGFRMLSRDTAGRMHTIEAWTDRGSSFWLIDTTTGQRTLLGRSAIARHADALAPVEPVSFPSRDGLTVHGYLTRPRSSEHHAMVLLVHGGPWARDYGIYSPIVQFLANRGYAVLQVNYRGSIGYGRRFREAAVGEFAGKMHDDLLDAVDWAVGRGAAERHRVAIMGWSYGGYATLVGLTFTPEVFACGIDVVGISNLVSMLERRHTYWTWHALRPLWHKYAGDPGHPEGRLRLEAKSPLFRASLVQRPLLIVHGANDPNVNLQESDQMVRALQSTGQEVEYVVFPDEGHGGFDTRNNVKLFEIVERFLARHLAEPDRVGAHHAR